MLAFQRTKSISKNAYIVPNSEFYLNITKSNKGCLKNYLDLRSKEGGKTTVRISL